MTTATLPPLPAFPEGLDAPLLQAIFAGTGALPNGVHVTDCKLTPVAGGVGMMSELIRVNLTYDGPSDTMPSSLVAKYPSRNPQNRAVAMSYNLYERETRYFRELDERTTAASPKIWLSDRQGDNFLILMEDMQAYRMGDQAIGADLHDTELMIDELAKLHGAFWNRVDDLAWVPGIGHSYHADNMAALIKVGWPNMVSIFGDFLDPAIAPRGDAYIAALPALQEHMNRTPRTLLHGDFRMENVFFGTQHNHKAVAIIDWQGPLLGNCMFDVALMLGQSTRTEVRRQHERGLIERYCKKLAAAGVTGYDLAQAWQDYEFAILFCWNYTAVVSGTLDASEERAFRWMSQMVARQSAASLDRDVFRFMNQS